jgi:hypothetical protein
MTFTAMLSVKNEAVLAAVAQFVEALRYKPAGHGFDSRWCQWIFFISMILSVALWPWGRLNL